MSDREDDDAVGAAPIEDEIRVSAQAPLEENPGESAPPQSYLDDPISQSYRSIVEAINRTSRGFQEGKKWKCVAGTPAAAAAANRASAAEQFQQQALSTRSRDSRHRKSRKSKMTHSQTVDERQMRKDSKKRPAAGGASAGGGGRTKRLVRQKATAVDDESGDKIAPPSASTGNVHAASSELQAPSSSSNRLLAAPPTHLRLSPNSRGFPVRQWTVDTCTAVAGHPGAPPGPGQAYLLRPVSRTSIMSDRLSPSGEGTRLATRSGARSPLTERIRLGDIAGSGSRAGSSFNQSSEGAASVTTRSSAGARSAASGTTGGGAAAVVVARHRIRKQRTCESAPMNPPPGGGGGGAGASGGGAPNGATGTAFGGSSRYLPRQHSNASAYSAVMPTSYSHQGITLVRGASCSLVDIPTYLGPSVAATGGVELAQVCDVKMAVTTPSGTAAGLPGGDGSAGGGEDSSAGPMAGDNARKNVRPRLQVLNIATTVSVISALTKYLSFP